MTGLHGLGISSVLLDGVDLSTETENTLAQEGTPELEVGVTNQGDSEESDIPVDVTVTGAEEPIEANEVIPKILPAEVQTVTVPLEPTPPTGTPVSIEVFIQPVLGEQVADDNEYTYDVTFE